MTYTMNDIRRYRRCPYEFHQDRLSDVWRITPDECLDLSVHDAAALADGMLLREGRSMDADAVTSAFWDAWDRHVPDTDPAPEEPLGLIRYGERCVSNHLRSGRAGDGRLVAAGVSATVQLDGGLSVIVPVDVIRMSGQTATVICYRTDPGVRSAEELSADTGMLLASGWVMSNVSGCTRARMVWIFLGSGVRVEAVPTMKSISAAGESAAEDIRRMDRRDGILPNESEHCRVCPYLPRCPRKAHENLLAASPGSVDSDDGVRLVDEYSEVQEKIDAVRRRLEDLERRRDEIAGRIVRYADSNGFMSLKGHGASALVRHETKVEMPADKGPVTDALVSLGLYDEYSMPNWSRIRSEISKGEMHPEIARLAEVSENPKVYFRRGAGSRR